MVTLQQHELFQHNRLTSAVAINWQTDLSTEEEYTFRNSFRSVLLFRKSGAGDCTVTVTKADGDTEEYTIPAYSDVTAIGPFNRVVFDSWPSHDVNFTLSETTGLSLALLHAYVGRGQGYWNN